MNKLFPFMALCALSLSAVANAQTSATDITPSGTIAAPGAAITTTTVNVPTGTPVVTQLKDGTKIEVYPDGAVFAVNADGSKVYAPEGTNVLADGTTLTVKGGHSAVNLQ